MEQTIKEKYLVSTFMTFFLIYSSLKGVSILNFQRIIAKYAEQDAWLSVIITGLSVHIIIWMIYKMLSPSKDILQIHHFCLGKLFGGILSCLLSVYFILISTMVFRTYIGILQLWVFPYPTWELALIMIAIIYYIVSGGFRVLVGLSFIGVIVAGGLLLLLLFPLRHAHLNNLLPVFNHSLSEIIQSSKSASFLFVGFETLLIYLPFIRDPQKSKKWAHFALLCYILSSLLISIVTILFFSQGQLLVTLWPTLSMTKIIEMPFVERFELIFISMWLLVIIPSICIPIWSSTRILKKTIHIKPNITLPFLLAIIFITTILIDERVELDALNDFISEISFYFVYGYIPLIFILFFIKKKVVKRI
ncbi:GerAB/ArcD/ProY family transporter [Cohnella sp.]|uniref:GerAB/ArcD/ProY family transporter n=1 Tax=Cohnella sp. TaxID=1883426 RepID=UPI0035678BD4